LVALSEKYWSQEVASNKLEKGLLRDYESAFCSILALMVLGKIFKDKPIFEVFGQSLTLK
jgi:hypothetical protein